VFGQGTFVVVAGRAIWQSDPVVHLDPLLPGGLAIEGPVGRAYRIDSAEVLGPVPDWQPRANFTLTTSPQSWTDPAPGPAPRFYRAVLLP
jgi:hypothetical protein